MKNRIFWAIIWIILILGAVVTLTEIGILPKPGTTKTTTEMYWQESPGGTGGTVRDSHRR